MTEIKVEVGQYRPQKKDSAFKATFSLVIYPQGQKILDCRYFIHGDKRWFNFPQKEVKYTDGRKNEYIPLVSYLNKEYLEQLKPLVLAAVKKEQEKHEQQNSTPTARKTHQVQAEPSFSDGDMPF